MRVVVDTNVFVSGLLKPSGFPREVLELVIDGDIELLIDERIFAEYYRIFHSKNLSLPKDEVGKLLHFVKHDSIWVEAKPLSTKLPDPDDQPFLEVSRAGDAKAIVTGNLRHFPGIVEAQSPTDFIQSLS